LAGDPEFAATLRELRTRLQGWITETDDHGAHSEGDADYLHALQVEKRKYFDKAMRRRGLDPGISPQNYLRWWKEQLGVTQDVVPQK
ncbi:MAG: arylsulfatase, partial [Maioricimonas sp. JB049]